MELKNIPPSMFVESKIFGNFKFDSPPGPLFYAVLLNYSFRYAIHKHIKKQSKFLDLWYSWLRFNKESDITRRFTWV